MHVSGVTGKHYEQFKSMAEGVETGTIPKRSRSGKSWAIKAVKLRYFLSVSEVL